MRHKTIKHAAFAAILLLFAAVSACLAYEGAVLVSEYQPVPALAGENVTFTSTLLNTGPDAWLGRDYEYRVLLFDSNMTLVAETARVFGEKDIPPGAMHPLENTFDIPAGWEGQYYFKVSIKTGAKTIEGERYGLRVQKKPAEEIPAEEKKPIFGISNGSFTMGLQSSPRYRNLADFGARFGGPSGGNNYDFNTSGRYRESAGNNAELQNILLTYNIPKAKLSFGDVNPSFSEYSLNYKTSRGALCEADLGRTAFSVVGTNTREKQESSGVYAQYLAGGRLRYKISTGVSAALNYVNTYDDKNSLAAAGSAQPASSEIISLAVDSNIRGADVNVEVAQSNYAANLLGPAGKINSTAFGVKTGYSRGSSAFGLRVSRIPAGFYNLASDSLTNDRMNYGFSLNQKVRDVFSFALNTDFSNDNIANLQTAPTTNMNNVSFSGNATIKNLPVVSMNVSRQSKASNEVLGYKTDDSTLSLFLGLNHAISKVNLSLSDNVSRFRDNTRRTNDSDSNTASFGVSLPVMKNISLASNFIVNSSRDLATLVSRDNNGINVNVIYNAGRISASAGLNTSGNTTSDNLTDNRSNSVSLGGSYRLNGMSLNGGMDFNTFDDKLNSAGNYSDNALKFSITYSF